MLNVTSGVDERDNNKGKSTPVTGRGGVRR
jgi:hypothetical protein